MMTGKAKIEGLTNSWYGFAVFSAICSLLLNGIGVFRLAITFFGLLFSWIVTFFLGRLLVNKSSLARVLLLLVSSIVMVLSGIGTARQAWTFVQSWELSTLVGAVYTAVLAWMHARSFRTLTDASVKSYIG